ncbi:MAG: response regulator, partial [Acidobacteriota bacterium]
MSRILIVDDEDHLAEGLAFNLRNAGYDVAITMSGEAALTRVEQESFDLILLDVTLPGISGLDVSRKLRMEGHTEPILMVSARDRTDDTISGLDAGADDYVTKP